MNLEALWHDLECGAYGEDLPLWRALAGEAGGAVLDVGAGTGRVTLDLAAGGVPVVALDADTALLQALEHRAAGLPVETVVADAREFALGRRFSLVLVPMQTLQLLGGPRGRAAFLRCALDHLEPGGLLAAALADALDCFDEEHDMPPPADSCEIGGRALRQPAGRGRGRGRSCGDPPASRDRRARGALRVPGRRGSAGPRVRATRSRRKAARSASSTSPTGSIPQTEEYLGSTVVVLRAP